MYNLSRFASCSADPDLNKFPTTHALKINENGRLAIFGEGDKTKQGRAKEVI